jgi:hypothetical protein
VENGKWKVDDGRWKEDGRRKTEDGRRKSEVGSRKKEEGANWDLVQINHEFRRKAIGQQSPTIMINEVFGDFWLPSSDFRQQIYLLN